MDLGWSNEELNRGKGAETREQILVASSFMAYVVDLAGT